MGLPDPSAVDEYVVQQPPAGDEVVQGVLEPCKVDCRAYARDRGAVRARPQHVVKIMPQRLVFGRLSRTGRAIADVLVTVLILVIALMVEQLIIDHKPRPAVPVMELEPGERNFEILYTGLSLTSSEKVRFQYRLDPLDAHWQYVGERRAAYYTRIPPGKYTFRVLAANRDGVWNQEGASIDIVVPPYMAAGSPLPWLEGIEVGLVQGQSIGYEGIAERLPAGVVFANATTVHEASTAELAVALTLTAQRGIDRFVRAQDAREWRPFQATGLADRRVMVLGYGGVGKAVAARLAPFEVDLVAVASTARDEDGVHVHAVDELPELLPGVDIVVVTLPGGEKTRHIVDDAFLSALPEGALVVNVGRGSPWTRSHVRRVTLMICCCSLTKSTTSMSSWAVW